ncbi:hypothetical protein C8J56DRAFT_191153, partial [Mycena floridula]
LFLLYQSCIVLFTQDVYSLLYNALHCLRRPARVRSVTPSSPPSPVFFGPDNPYNPRTAKGREFIARRDSGAFPTDIDNWLHANMGLWARTDPRAVTTTLFPDEVTCKVQIVYNVVRVAIHDSIFLDSLFLRLQGKTPSPPRRGEDPFMDFSDTGRFELQLTVTLPDEPLSAFPELYPLPAYKNSPVAIINTSYHARNSPLAPDWCNSLTLGAITMALESQCLKSTTEALVPLI